MSTKKLSKNTLTANLIALAAADAAHDDEHRARFETLIKRIRTALDEIADVGEHLESHFQTDWAEVRQIAKHRLRMSAEKFEAAVVSLNTPVSRVINTCPSGRDVRDLPEFMLMTAEELRLSYRLSSVYDATKFISERGAIWGYSASEIARAKKEHRPLEQARLDRLAAGAEQVAAASPARFDEFLKANHVRRLAYEATNPPVPDYVFRDREWSSRTLDPRDFLEVVYEEEEFSTYTPEEIEQAKDEETRYLRSHSKNMIREMEKLTEQTFDRRWKTKAELHAALRAHFKSCGYDEELDLRWLRFGAYTDPSYH